MKKEVSFLLDQEIFQKLEKIASLENLTVEDYAKKCVSDVVHEEDKKNNLLQKTIIAYQDIVGPMSFVDKIYVNIKSGYIVVTVHADITTKHCCTFTMDKVDCEYDLSERLGVDVNINCVQSDGFDTKNYRQIYPVSENSP